MWESANHTSPIGRTRTAPPKGSQTAVRMAYSSCQHYNYGYFGPAHLNAAAEDLDLYVFLGDYVYERGLVPGSPVRADRIDAVDLDRGRQAQQGRRLPDHAA